MLSTFASRLVRFLLTSGRDDEGMPIADDTRCALRTQKLVCDDTMRGWVEYWLEQSQQDSWLDEPRHLTLSATLDPPVSTATRASEDTASLWRRFYTDVMPNALSVVFIGADSLSQVGGCCRVSPVHAPEGATWARGTAPHLAQLAVTGCALTAELTSQMAPLLVQQLPALREMTLDSTGLTSAVLRTILAALMQRRRLLGEAGVLHHFSVRSNCLHACVLPAITCALYEEDAVRVFDLSDNSQLFQLLQAPCADDTVPDACSVSESAAALVLGVTAVPVHVPAPRTQRANGVGQIPATPVRHALSLAGCDLSQALLAGLRAPVGGTSLPLHTLDLSGTSLGDAGVRHLLSLLCACPQTRGGDIPALGTRGRTQGGSAVWLTLECLRLRGVGCRPATVEQLATLLTCDAPSPPSGDAAHAAVFPPMPSLRELDISQNSLLTWQGCSAAASLIVAMLGRGRKQPTGARATRRDVCCPCCALYMEFCDLPSTLVASVDAAHRSSSASHISAKLGAPFEIFLGGNRLTSEAVLALRSILTPLAAPRKMDVYVEGNPLQMTGTETLLQHSVCHPLSVPHNTACWPRLSWDVVADSDPSTTQAESATGVTHSPRGASLRARSSGPCRAPGSPSPSPRVLPRGTEHRDSSAEPHSHPSKSTLKTNVSANRDSASPHRTNAIGTTMAPSEPHVATSPFFLDAAEMAELMAETEAIIRARLGVMGEGDTPCHNEPTLS